MKSDKNDLGPKPKIWEDSRIFAINRRPMNATAVRYQDRDQALSDEASSQYISLNGSWKFDWTSSMPDQPEVFFRLDFDDRSWDDLEVPGTWQMQGYGSPHYRNIGLPPGIDEKHPPRIDPEKNSLGRYRKIFTIPESWKKQTVILHLGAVQSAFQVWVNGKEVGYSQDSRLPAEFEITDFLVPGENLIAALVFRFSDGSYLEDQDMWYLNGIFRDVYLYSTSPTRIEDFYLRCDLDSKYQHARFLGDVTLLRKDLRNRT